VVAAWELARACEALGKWLSKAIRPQPSSVLHLTSPPLLSTWYYNLAGIYTYNKNDKEDDSNDGSPFAILIIASTASTR